MPAWSSSLNRLLQLLRRPERDLLARGDLDRLTRSRVPPHASWTVLYLENAEAAHPDFVALDEVGGQRLDEAGGQPVSLLLRKAMALADLFEDRL